MLVRPFAVLATALALIWPAASLGQARDRTAAEAMFRAGRDAAREGDFATACQRFAESNRLDPAVGTVFNLAHCREQLGQVASAWQLYNEVLDRVPSSDQRAEMARQRVQELEPRLPYLTLQLAPSAPEGATVRRDGIELGSASLGLELPVDPGKHRVTVVAPGHAERSYEVELAEAAHQKLLVEAGEPVAASSGPTAMSSGSSAGAVGKDVAPSSHTSTAGYIIGGVGLAGVVVGLGAGALALSDKATIERDCVDKRCGEEGMEAADRGQTMSTIATVACAVGLAGVGVGAYLILTDDGDPATASVGAAMSPAGGALLLRGQF